MKAAVAVAHEAIQPAECLRELYRQPEVLSSERVPPVLAAGEHGQTPLADAAMKTGTGSYTVWDERAFTPVRAAGIG